MNKEEILAMKPGEALDNLIIKKLMHHVWDDGDRPRCKICGVWKDWNKPAGCQSKPYSTEISAASLLVDEDGAWDIKKRFRPHPDDPDCSPGRATYQAIVVITKYEDLVETSEQKFRSPWCWSLPEAICKAALLVKLAK